MPLEKRGEARRLLKKAKAEGTPQADINAAATCILNKGARPRFLKKRLQRWGFSEAEAHALVNQT